jgi:hypothetical protein
MMEQSLSHHGSWKARRKERERGREREERERHRKGIVIRYSF